VQLPTLGKKISGLAAVLIVAVVFLFYSNSLSNGYNLDDELVTNNHYLTSQGIKAIPAIFKAAYYVDEAGYKVDYRPVTVATFALEHQFFQQTPFVSRLVNLFLYSLTGLVLFFFLQRLTKRQSPYFALAVTLLFLAHPLHTEVVNNIKCRDELLALLLGLLANYVCLMGQSKARWYAWYGLGIGLFAMALLAKLSALPFAVLIPVSLLLFERAPLVRSLLLGVVLGLLSCICLPPVPGVTYSLILGGIGSLIFVISAANTLLANDPKGLVASLRSLISVNPHFWLIGGLATVAALWWLPLPVAGKAAALVLAIVIIAFTSFKEKIWLHFLPLLFIVGMSVSPALTDRLSTYGIFALLYYLILINFNYQKHRHLLVLFLAATGFFVLVSVYHQTNIHAFTPLSYFLIYLLLKRSNKTGVVYSVLVLLPGLLGSVINIYQGSYPSAILIAFWAAACLTKKSQDKLFQLGMVVILGLSLLSLFTDVNINREQGIRVAPQPTDSAPDISAKRERNILYLENPIGYQTAPGIRSATAMSTVTWYTQHLIWPVPLVAYYGFDTIPMVGWDTLTAWIGLLILLALAGLILVTSISFPLFSYAVLMLFVGLIQYSNLLFEMPGIVGERFIYLGSLGFVILLAGLWKVWVPEKLAGASGGYPTAFLLVVLLVMSGLYVRDRNKDWESITVLFENDVQHVPRSAKVQNLLGLAYLELATTATNPAIAQENYRKAALHLRRGVAIYDQTPYGNYDLGRVLLKLNRREEGEAFITQSLRTDTYHVEALLYLGTLAEESGNGASAINYYEKAIQHDPNYIPAYVQLSTWYFTNGYLAEGITVCNNGLAHSPNNFNLLVNKGNGLVNLGNIAEAVTSFSLALAQQPTDRNLMGKLLYCYQQLGNATMVQRLQAQLQAGF